MVGVAPRQADFPGRAREAPGAFRNSLHQPQELPEERVLKGYRREHFEDAFARYLKPPPFVAATPLLRPPDGHNLHASRPLPGDGGSGRANSENPNNHAQSSGVAAVKAPKSSANGPAIPIMITHAMKDQLRGRGLSDDCIANLTPQGAHEILNRPADNMCRPSTAASSKAPSQAS